MQKLKLILCAIGRDLADTWKRSKMVLLALLGIAAAIEVRKIEEESAVNVGEKEITKDKAEDANLNKTEISANSQADTLVAQAQILPSQELAVKPDWYKDSK